MAAGHPRLSASILSGVIIFLLLPAGWRLSLRAILAWDGFAAIFLLLALLAFAAERLDQMEQAAEAQREGEWTIFAVTLIGVSMSFVSITQEFELLKNSHQMEQFRVALVALTLLLTWLVTHVCFAFRYAHEYYEREPDPSQGGVLVCGGLDFPGGQAPDYWDFMYFSLVLGMTFQVSDVEITSRKLRRLATLHGLLGFMFNTVLLAFAVNLAASLL